MRKNRGHGCQQERELHQFRRRVPPEREGHRIQHLHALRHHVVKRDAPGKACPPDVFVGKSQMIRDAVREDLGSERVHEIPEGVDAENGGGRE